MFSSRRASITADLRGRAARFEQRYGRAPSQRELAHLAQAVELRDAQPQARRAGSRAGARGLPRSLRHQLARARRRCFGSMLVALAAIDYEHFLLPDVITLSGIAAGVLISLRADWIGWREALLGAALGGGGLWLLAQAWLLLRHEEGMGLGDVKMLAMVGAFLGWQGVLVTVSWARSRAPSSVWPIAAGRLDLGSRLPFGVFLSGGAMVALFAGPALSSPDTPGCYETAGGAQPATRRLGNAAGGPGAAARAQHLHPAHVSQRCSAAGAGATGGGTSGSEHGGLATDGGELPRATELRGLHPAALRLAFADAHGQLLAV